MDQFVVSARKYRPATFNSVVGQASITTTLKNAIKNKHLAQAFLFCGPRGVGKTTCARILAKTINCTNLTSETEGCNECESCVSFNNGQSLNIFELDAASNNTVDDMRNLVDQVRYPPQSGQYKIYIIDEVHMLTTQAFNAFLKTLEEPPAYAIFILATTEKHKIIPTILSRCQIFDFNRITTEDISKLLMWISEQEKVTSEPEALHLIAQKADGALRDALSIFDQIVSYGGDTVSYKHVIENLNILDYEYYFKVTDHILENNFPASLLLLNELIADGFDIHHFITGLSVHFRDLLVCKDPQTHTLLETGAKTKEKYKAQSGQCPVQMLYQFLEITNRCDLEFKQSQNQRLHVELALLKLCNVNGVLTGSLQANTSETAPTKKKVNEPGTATVEKIIQPAASGNQKAVESKAQEKEVITENIAPSQSEPATSSTKESHESTPIKIGTRQRSAKSGTISISEQLDGGSSKPSEEIPDSFNNRLPENEESFTEEQANAVLKKFVDKLLLDGRKQLAAALNKHPIGLKNENVIEIPVDNAIQSNDIQSNKSELLGWMKENLKNNRIEIIQRVVDENDLTDTAYTPAEKFNKMAEKNPDLNHLKQQFGLELDF